MPLLLVTLLLVASFLCAIFIVVFLDGGLKCSQRKAGGGSSLERLRTRMEATEIE
jgi:hypothetical protein